MDMSEVARLRRRIAEECEASWWALYGLASGMAQHEFIRARFRRMEDYHTRLSAIVGEEEATTILCEVYNGQASEQGPRNGT